MKAKSSGIGLVVAIGVAILVLGAAAYYAFTSLVDTVASAPGKAASGVTDTLATDYGKAKTALEQWWNPSTDGQQNGTPDPTDPTNPSESTQSWWSWFVSGAL